MSVDDGFKTPIPSSGELKDDDSASGNDILSRLCRMERRLDTWLGLESDAISRKLPEDRKPVKWHEELTMALLWASGTMNTSCFATGFLGREIGLSLRQTITISIFGSILGASLSGFAAILGAPTGLRQISVSRYSFGWWPNKIIAALNAITQVGWSAVACITGGLALAAVADGHLTLVVGIIILATVAVLISLVGLKAILVYERYAWLIFFIIFVIIMGETGRFADNTTPSPLKGADLSGSVLTLLAVVYGSSASWSSLASDYYAHYPTDVSHAKVFFMTTFGISIPTSIGMVAGCVVASALNNRPDWAEIYDNQGVGFLIQAVLYPRGFAKFILTLLVLSGINVTVISIYSASIALQQFSRSCARIPRILWTLLCYGVILALALAGRERLNLVLQNFLSLLGYWSTSYFLIIFLEHYVFRKGNFKNYDLEAWNDPARLPIGLGALAAFLVGVVGWVLGMVEVWFAGPVGRLIGSEGGDVGNELTLVLTLITYLPVRYWELKTIGR